MQTLTGIDDLHRLVINLHTHTQAPLRIDILCRENANGNFAVSSEIHFILHSGAIPFGSRWHHHIVYAHTALAPSQIGKENPLFILFCVFIGRDRILFRTTARIQVLLYLKPKRHRVVVFIRN